MSQPSESELIAKLVAYWHLDARERKALPNGEAKGSLVVAAVERSVVKAGCYPITWRPDSGFDGGLVERQANGSCIVYWKAEVALARFELQEAIAYSSLRKACTAYARRFFGSNIDGVRINWVS